MRPARLCSTRMARSLLEPRWILGALLALVVAAGCASLGLWQLRRLDERRAFNASVERAVGSAPVPLSQAVAQANDPADLAYRRVSISGIYDPEREVVVFGRTLAGLTGSEVLTPLVRDGGTAVMVDRGWVPLNLDTPPVAGAAPPRGRVQAEGILWPPEAEGEVDAGAAPVAQLGRIDLGRLRAQLPYRIEPVYLRLLAQRPPNSLALPKPVPLPALDEGPHMSYAVQWFIFGSVAVIGYGALAARELRDRAHHRETERPSDAGGGASEGRARMRRA
jgi:surfeit locus 1 family protein